MKKLLLIATALIISTNLFAMTDEQAQSCMDDSSNTSLQTSFQNFAKAYQQAGNIIESSTNALDILQEQALDQVENEVKNCSELEQVYTVATDKLTAVIKAVEAITGETVDDYEY